jgi:hypothetical protein
MPTSVVFSGRQVPPGLRVAGGRISRHLYRLYMNERPGFNARSVKQDADKPGAK